MGKRTPQLLVRAFLDVLTIVTVLECGWTLGAGESDLIEHVDKFAIGSFRLVNCTAVGTVV